MLCRRCLCIVLQKLANYTASPVPENLFLSGFEAPLLAVLTPTHSPGSLASCTATCAKELTVATVMNV